MLQGKYTCEGTPLCKESFYARSGPLVRTLGWRTLIPLLTMDQIFSWGRFTSISASSEGVSNGDEMGVGDNGVRDRFFLS